MAELVPVSVSFGDADQVFNIGPASVGTYGVPAACRRRAARFGRIPLAELVAPAARLARTACELNAAAGVRDRDPGRHRDLYARVAALFAPEGQVLRRGDVVRQPELADALERLGAEGAAPFYTGDIAAAIVEWLATGAGSSPPRTSPPTRLSTATPIRASYRGRDVVTNPPPSAGGILIAHALALLDADAGATRLARIVATMERTQAERTPGVPRGPRRSGVRRAVPRAALAARVDDPRRGARPRRMGLLGHLLQRIVLGRGRPRHRRPSQQHARRAGPQPARLPPPSRRAAGCRA